MFAYFFSVVPMKVSFRKVPILIVMSVLIMLWWSGAYWKYIDRKIQRFFPQLTQVEEGKISKNTYALSGSADNVGMEKWVFSDLRAFKKIYMPESTVKGINRLMQLDAIKTEKPKVLNMSELTPLAHEIGYELEVNKPLWYHKGVGIFQPQIDDYVQAIENGYYDLVLFEIIPYLNNFYPEEIRTALQEHYQLADQFLAPRRPTDSTIEVYIRKTEESEQDQILEVNQ